jgi:hypothetical protein
MRSGTVGRSGAATGTSNTVEPSGTATPTAIASAPTTLGGTGTAASGLATRVA